jgi:predicted metal-dependent hydrolase
MSRHAHIDLPDGRQLDYEIRSTDKARSLRLKMTARDGLTVIAPKGLSDRQVVELVSGKWEWIASHLDQFNEVQHLLGPQETVRPEAFDLPALAESWRVEYQQTKGKTVGARTEQPGRVLVYGSVYDYQRCNAALRRWLARRAKETLAPWLESLSKATGLRYSDLTVKTQRTRWGSCSAEGRISLNCKLLFLPRDSVRYVLTHELCHTQEMNHTAHFWALVRCHEPNAERLHAEMRDAWKQVPPWSVRVPLGEKSF